ncbi:MAG: transglutaminase domain-containing protein [Deltaproteobacteria bacterium]|nr:transglutaminase domain-containing protein [Deltaproteobacteria bacterium]
MKTFALLIAFIVALSQPLRAATLVLDGAMDGEISVSQERVFSVPQAGLTKLVFRFANPAEFKSATIAQSLLKHNIVYSPKPDSEKTETDQYGNNYTSVQWTNLKKDATVKETFTVRLSIELKDIKSSAVFPMPVEEIPVSERVYLKPTEQVQVNDAEVQRLSAALTKDAKTEQEAVSGILNWVVDNIKYKTPIPDYGAVWTLKTGHGNCQNYAHLSIALLRSVGIPARIVGGIALDKKWKVPMTDGSLIQGIGQGGHAWMEVWYPDIGWVAFDPQQSHLFVSPRHVKQTVGLDSVDVNDSWRASPALPPFREDISSEFLKDDIRISLKKTMTNPGNYILSTSFATVPKSLPAVSVEPPARPPADRTIEFGNMEFPEKMNFYVTGRDNTGYKTFDKETAEYVTGDVTYAQAFTVERDLKMEEISLAMHKFGGRLGSLWVDVVADSNGRPGAIEGGKTLIGARSMPLFLDTVKYHPGYKWFDFTFSRAPEDRPVLKPGRYWVILRRSKDAIVNWYYTPGNLYGGPEDARSTEKGIDWSNLMNYDFNFKVKGAYLN